MSFLHTIRSKDERIKRRIAAMIATIGTLVVFMIWTSLHYIEKKQSEPTIGLFESIIVDISKGIKATKNKVTSQTSKQEKNQPQKIEPQPQEENIEGFEAPQDIEVTENLTPTLPVETSTTVVEA